MTSLEPVHLRVTVQWTPRERPVMAEARGPPGARPGFYDFQETWMVSGGAPDPVDPAAGVAGGRGVATDF